MKAQASVELIVISGVFMLFVLLGLVLVKNSLFDVKVHTALWELDASLDALERAGSLVSSQGTGSIAVVPFRVPGGVTQVKLQNQSVAYEVEVQGARSVLHRKLSFVVNGSLPNDPGQYAVHLTNNKGVINVSSKRTG